MLARIAFVVAVVATVSWGFEENEHFTSAVHVVNLTVPGDLLQETIDLDRRHHPHHHHRRCNVTKLTKCYKAFRKDLGMKTEPKNATEFVKKLGEIVEKEHKAGFEKICKASHKFFQCLGHGGMVCLAYHPMIRRGVKPEDAIVYDVAARQIGYECTRGYKVITEKWDCIVKTGNKSAKALKKCGEDFVKHVKQHKEQVCRYTNQFLGCYSAPFSKACGAQTGHVLCETSRIAFKTFLHHKCHRLQCRGTKLHFHGGNEDV